MKAGYKILTATVWDAAVHVVVVAALLAAN